MNDINPDKIPGNLSATISDHLHQFAIVPKMFCNTTSNKSNTHEWDCCKFPWDEFLSDYFSIDWEDFLKTDELNNNHSTQIYLKKD